MRQTSTTSQSIKGQIKDSKALPKLQNLSPVLPSTSLEQLQQKYNRLAGRVRRMLAAQQAYFKSDKDPQLLREAKALEAEVNNIVNPKPVSQAHYEWLAQ